jgi:hypothetical protein
MLYTDEMPRLRKVHIPKFVCVEVRDIVYDVELNGGDFIIYHADDCIHDHLSIGIIEEIEEAARIRLENKNIEL